MDIFGFKSCCQHLVTLGKSLRFPSFKDTSPCTCALPSPCLCLSHPAMRWGGFLTGMAAHDSSTCSRSHADWTGGHYPSRAIQSLLLHLEFGLRDSLSGAGSHVLVGVVDRQL